MSKIYNHNGGKKEIRVLENFLVQKNVRIRESDEHMDFNLSHIRSDLGVPEKHLKMFTCAGCYSLIFAAKYF